MSNSRSSTTFETAPRLSLGVFGQKLGININDGAAALHDEGAAPAGQSSSQTTTSGRSSQSTSFKSHASPPLTGSSPPTSNVNPNFLHATRSTSSAGHSSPSRERLIEGASPFSTSKSKNDGPIESSISPSVSTSTSRNLPPSSLGGFPSRTCMVLYRLPTTKTKGRILEDPALPPGILLDDRQRAGGLIAYLYDPDEDDNCDDEDGWLHDVEDDEEFVEYGFGRVCSGSVADTSINGKQPSSEYSRKGSLGYPAKLYGKSEQIPIPTPLPLPHPASDLPPPCGIPSKTRIPAAGPQRSWYSSISFRGLSNVSSLIILIVCLLGLFIAFPAARAFTDNSVATKVLGNTRINATGQLVEDSRREFVEGLIIVKFEPEGR